MSSTAVAATLRHATVQDTKILASIHTTSWQHSYRNMIPDKYLDEEVENERLHYWHDKMSMLVSEKDSTKKRLLLIAENKRGEAIGFVSGEWDPECTWGALLDNFHVLPSYQGAGAGQCMMLAFTNWARELGVTQLYLYVLEKNTKAITFYERRGWQLSERTIGHIGGVDVECRRYIHFICS